MACFRVARVCQRQLGFLVSSPIVSNTLCLKIALAEFTYKCITGDLSGDLPVEGAPVPKNDLQNPLRLIGPGGGVSP